MCGFCGKLNFDPEEPVSEELLLAMTATLHHRGPDGTGLYCRGPVGLGHRRLSIIDLSTGDQPMSNEDGTVWVVYNGEVYNFRDLRRDLERRGHHFRTNSDTEVIVHLYEQDGPEGVARLQGMFAFAVWDERRHRLLLARDRVGIKPLYFVNTGRALLFASEIKALLKDSSVPRELNPVAVDRFLTYYYVPGRETLLRNVYKLEPAHYLTAEDGAVRVRRYWDLRFERGPQTAEFAEAVGALDGLLRTTVRNHLIADVPVGVLLSGGVDSTGVLSYAAEESGNRISTFTVGFSGEEFADERPYARLAVERFGTEHHEVTFGAREFLDFLPHYAWHMEEPVCEPPAVALYYVARLARECGVKVLLSGEGGDEAFGGYQTYRNLLILERMKRVLGPARGLLAAGMQVASWLGVSRLRRFVPLVSPRLEDYYLSRTSDPWRGLASVKHRLYSEEFKAALRGIRSDEPTREAFSRVDGADDLSRMLYVDSVTWLPDDLLVKADKMTMATSVELRVPLLDHQVLEFAASLPPEFKVSGWSMKRVLKAVLKERVPSPILLRKKTGFPVPYERWLAGLRGGELAELGPGRANATTRWFFNRLPLMEWEREGDKNGDRPGLRDLFALVILDLTCHQLMSSTTPGGLRA
ncbi:MAG: amidotransferase 1, exosortase A system-associated [Acidobacteriota bacterium]